MVCQSQRVDREGRIQSKAYIDSNNEHVHFLSFPFLFLSFPFQKGGEEEFRTCVGRVLEEDGDVVCVCNTTLRL